MSAIMGSLNPAGDYDKAAQYYAKLKENLLNKVSNNYRKKARISTVQMERMINRLSNGMVTIASQNAYTAQQEAEKTLMEAKQIIDGAIDTVLGTNIGNNLKTNYERVSKEVEAKEKDIYKAKKMLYNELSKMRDEVYTALFNDGSKLENVLSKIKLSYANGDVSDIEAQLYGYFDRYIADRIALKGLEGKVEPYRIRTGGYYRELAEYKALKNYAQATMKNANVIHSGSTNNELDITITFGKKLDNIKQMLDYKEKLTLEMDALNPEDHQAFIKIAYKKNDLFGEQVKSWSLSQKARASGYSIGHRKELLDAFTNSKQPYSSRNVAAFLGQFKSILKTFGYSTVLFSTGNKRY